ncbi:hypothetical protein ACFO4E_11230 [Nocardiopsis mangrovi]|uniref:DUF7134 domain-containing protein n=1 Tax=Nocardiopsis mangrovi TaxID=1179818 RepID=A0ABV9DWV0_9ACTN
MRKADRMFGDARSVLRRREALVDAVALAPFLLLHLLRAVGYAGTEAPGGIPVVAHTAAAFGLLPPPALRRRYPVGALAAVPAVALAKRPFRST